MEFRQIKYFVCLADNKNFTKAAQKLFVTQPTLSQQILSLEQELNCALFHRTKRSVELTQAGELFYKEASALLEQYQRCLDVITEMQSSTKGQILLSTVDLFPDDFLAQFIYKFQNKYPNIKIQHRTDNFSLLLQGIREQTIDIAVNLVDPQKDYKRVKIKNLIQDDDKLVAIVRKTSPYSEIQSFSDKKVFDLLNTACYLYTGWHSYESLLDGLKQFNEHIKLKYYDHISDFFYGNYNRDGFTILPKKFFQNNIGTERYHYIYFPEPLGNLNLALTYYNKNSNPCLKTFMQDFIQMFNAEETHTNHSHSIQIWGK